MRGIAARVLGSTQVCDWASIPRRGRGVYRVYSRNASLSTTSLVINSVGGFPLKAGDVIIAVVVSANNAVTLGISATGLTFTSALNANNVNTRTVGVLYHVVASDTNMPITSATHGTSTIISAHLSVWRGVDPTTPVSTGYGALTATDPLVVPAFTAPPGSAAIAHLASSDDNSLYPNSVGWYDDYSANPTSGYGVMVTTNPELPRGDISLSVKPYQNGPDSAAYVYAIVNPAPGVF